MINYANALIIIVTILTIICMRLSCSIEIEFFRYLYFKVLVQLEGIEAAEKSLSFKTQHRIV